MGNFQKGNGGRGTNFFLHFSSSLHPSSKKQLDWHVRMYIVGGAPSHVEYTRALSLLVRTVHIKCSKTENIIFTYEKGDESRGVG